MHAFTFVAPFLLVASSLAQAVEEGVAPDSDIPQGCEASVQGNFTIGVQNFFAAAAKRETAQEAADGLLLCTLEDGVLRDQYSRTGSIVANHQFQFDGPPQAGALYTGGFSVCQNKSLAIGGSARWWRCMSGEFGNLYDTTIGEQCTEIRILVDFVDKPTPSSSSVVLASSTSTASSTGGTSSTSAADLTLATSGTRTASVVSSRTDHASHSMTSGAPTGVASPTSSASISSSVTVTRSSASSSSTSETSVPEVPVADGGAPLVKGVAIWSVLVTIGFAWMF